MTGTDPVYDEELYDFLETVMPVERSAETKAFETGF
jgi:hypothetical protein